MTSRWSLMVIILLCLCPWTFPHCHSSYYSQSAWILMAVATPPRREHGITRQNLFSLRVGVPIPDNTLVQSNTKASFIRTPLYRFGKWGWEKPVRLDTSVSFWFACPFSDVHYVVNVDRVNDWNLMYSTRTCICNFVCMIMSYGIPYHKTKYSYIPLFIHVAGKYIHLGVAWSGYGLSCSVWHCGLNSWYWSIFENNIKCGCYVTLALWIMTILENYCKQHMVC